MSVSMQISATISVSQMNIKIVSQFFSSFVDFFVSSCICLYHAKQNINTTKKCLPAASCFHTKVMPGIFVTDLIDVLSHVTISG